MDDDLAYMQAALEEAKKAQARDEVPIGAVMVDTRSGEIVAAHGNETIAQADPSAHAEILCIRAACEKEGAQRIPDYDLFVTLEPCTMCAAAISFARVRRIVFGARDEKGGAVLSGVRFYDQKTCHHRPIVESGLCETECGDILRNYFRGKRKSI